MNAVANTILIWSSAILGLLSVLWQLKRAISKISEFFEFVKGLEPQLQQMKTSAINTDRMLTEHIRDHPGGTRG